MRLFCSHVPKVVFLVKPDELELPDCLHADLTLLDCPEGRNQKLYELPRDTLLLESLEAMFNAFGSFFAMKNLV